MKNFIKYITENIRPPLLMITLIIAGNAIGQNDQQLSEKFNYIAKPGSTKQWIDFFQDNTIKARTIFTDFKDAFQLSDDDEMQIKRIKKDDIGFTHYRYQQFYKHHPVVYGEYIVHEMRDGL